MQMTHLLLVVAGVLAIFSGSIGVFIIAVLIGAACGIYGLFHMLARTNMIRFSYVLATSLLLGYAFGASVYLINTMITEFNVDPTQNAFGLSYDQTDISFAFVIILLVSTMLYSISRWEDPIFETFSSVVFVSCRARLIVWLGAGIVLLAVVVGELGYMGTAVSESRNISALGAFSSILAQVLLPLTALCLFEDKLLWRRILHLMTFVLLILVLLLLGRRVLLFSLITVAIAFVISGHRLPKYSKKQWVRVGLGGLLLATIAYFGFTFFFAFRLSIYELGDNTSMSEIVINAFRIINSEEGVSDRLNSNVIERPFILSYFAGFVSAQKTYSPLFGEVVIHAFLTAIPSLFYPEKTAILPDFIEQTIHPAFGLYIFDGPNSIITAGFNDFGYVGALVYPVIPVLLYIGVRRISRATLPIFIYYMVMFRLIFLLLFVEQSMEGMLTTGLRDLMLITLISLFIWRAILVRQKQ